MKGQHRIVPLEKPYQVQPMCKLCAKQSKSDAPNSSPRTEKPKARFVSVRGLQVDAPGSPHEGFTLQTFLLAAEH